MTSTTRTLLLAAAILAAPVAAFAQSNPTGNLGSNNSATATPQTADNPVSGLQAGDANAKPKTSSGAAQNLNVPGATGQTVVPGSNSTIANDRPSTANSKTDGASNGR